MSRRSRSPSSRARERGYTFVSHQQEVGAGYFDDVTTTIQGGASSVTALTGSTEENSSADKGIPRWAWAEGIAVHAVLFHQTANLQFRHRDVVPCRRGAARTSTPFGDGVHAVEPASLSAASRQTGSRDCMTELNARRIAGTILDGFDRHYRIFLEITAAARHASRALRLAGAAPGRQRSHQPVHPARHRGHRAPEARSSISPAKVDEELWREVESCATSACCTNTKQPELAETFYSSVFTLLFHRRYYNNDNIFVRPRACRPEYLDDDDPVYDSYYPMHQGPDPHRAHDPGGVPERPAVRRSKRTATCDDWCSGSRHAWCAGSSCAATSTCRCCVRRSTATRQPISSGARSMAPTSFRSSIPILNNERGGVYRRHAADGWRRHRQPVQLRARLLSWFRNTDAGGGRAFSQPHAADQDQSRPVYGDRDCRKQGKTEFYRGFLHHLSHSTDQLEIAPGVKGHGHDGVHDAVVPRTCSRSSTTTSGRRRRSIAKRSNASTRSSRCTTASGAWPIRSRYSYAAFPIARINDELLAELKEKCGKSLAIRGRQRSSCGTCTSSAASIR